MLDPGKADALNHKRQKPSELQVCIDMYIHIHRYTHLPCELENVLKACFV